MQRIGLFGGSFDPIHLGHLMVAHAAHEQLGLTRLMFIPAARSPFKPEQAPAPDNERLRLVRLALAGLDWCGVDEQEIARGGVSYTIDTVQDYTRRFPGAELFYLIGADQLPQLRKWRQSDELARLAEFVVIERPGQDGMEIPKPFRGRTLTGVPMAISSSDIRARVKAVLPIGHLVPQAVAEAICNYRLYL